MSAPRITRDDLLAALPDVRSTLKLRGLEAPVDIWRDSYGIPHVRARTLHDAFFGQGFATAQDRLWHMEYDRRRACGRWAEFAGAEAVENDILYRRLRLAASAQQDYRTASAEAKAMLNAYAAGVNAFLTSTRSLPIEYRIVGEEPEPWLPWHSLAVYKVRHALMGVFEMKLWRAALVRRFGPERAARLFPGYEDGQLLILPPGETFKGPDVSPLEHFESLADSLPDLPYVDGGSNNWALHGSRTASGKPIVAGDPHRALDTPNVYYQNHVTCPDFDVSGLSFPGVPGFPHFGHNRYVAWCVTHAMADYQDLYIERFKSGSPRLYLFRGRWHRASVFHETVKVRGQQDVHVDVTVTRHGPIIVGEPSKGWGIALRYTATDGPCTFAETLLPQLRARSARQLEESMRQWVDPCNNFTFADTRGNIGYRTRGKVPIRSMANAWLPVPGWTGEHEWQGFIPFEKMPHARNPKKGYVVTANHRIVGKEYPYYIGTDFRPEWRARRITERLLSLNKARAEDMALVHGDITSIPAREFQPLLARLKPRDRAVAEAVKLLLAWDCVTSADRAEPLIWNAFRDELLRLAVEPLLGTKLTKEALSGTGRGGPTWASLTRARLHTMIRENDRTLLQPGQEWDALMERAMEGALTRIRKELGPDMAAWRWGTLHRTAPKHTLSGAFPELAGLLDPLGIPMSGDADCPQNATYPIGTNFIVSGLSTARYVFDLGDWENSRWVIPLGVSGHPGSPHYADQVSIWGKWQYVPMPYSLGRIRESAESHQRLRPARRRRE